MKRLLAALLTLSMMVSVVPFSAFADSPGTAIAPDVSATAQEDTSTPVLDEDTVQAINSDPLLHGQYAPAQSQQARPTVDTSDVTMEATDGLGRLLMNSINEQNGIPDGEERVIDVTVDIPGRTATVKYVSSQDADLVVALYSDDTEEEMVASGTADAPAMLENTGSTEATVSLTGTIPNSFKVKAFLLDKAEHAPLCNEYSSSAYTKDIQDIENATVNDYPEDRVINLDDDDSTNFAVVNGDAVLVDASDASAGGMSVTDNGGSYTISNADERTRNLQPGGIFVYQEGDAVLVLRVDSISVNGNDVTITGNNDDLDLMDVFDVVKIESIDDGEPMEYSPVGADASVQYCGIVDASSPLDETNSLSLDASPTSKTAIKFIIGSDTFYDGEKTDITETKHVTSKAGLNAVLNLKLTTTFKFHLAFDNVSFSFFTDSEIFGGVEVSYSESYAIDLGELKKELPGVYLDYTPQFVLNGEVKGTFKYTITSKDGFAYENKEFHDISEQPVTNLSITVSGTFYVGVKFAPSLKVGVHNPFKAPTKENFIALVTFTLSLDIGEEVKLESTIPTDPVAANQITSAYHGTSVHECVSCLSGTLQFKVKITVKADSLKVLEGSFTPVDYAPSPHPFYFSADYVDANFGTCPHQLYLVNISIDSAYSPVGAEVFATDESKKTYSLGNLIGSTNNYCYMRPGKYSLKTTVNGDLFDATVTVDSNTGNSGIKVTLKYDLSGDDSPIVSSGTCGENLKWTLSEQGTLTITGTGEMSDYKNSYDKDTHTSTTDTPWFEHRLDIKKIVIQNGITSIGDCAFAYCSNVEAISIPDTVASIGGAAFNACSSLRSVTIPYGVKEIKPITFYNCTSLTSVTFPDNITSIGMMAFEGCTSLTDITLPNSVTSISSYAFMDCAMTDIVLPDGLTYLGAGAFANCSNLTSFVIPRNITAIPYELLSGCTNLTSVSIPDTVTTIGTNALADCPNLTSIRIPSGVTAIGEYAFSKCTGLTSIELPNRLAKIMDGTFENCSDLTSITIPVSVTAIGDGAFENCFSLTTINYAGTASQWEKISIGSNNDMLEKAYAGTPVSSCGDNLTWKFKDGTLTISGTGEMTSAPWSDYNNTYKFGTIKNFVLENGVTSICRDAFYWDDLESVTIPVTLTTIDDSAFNRCTINVVYYAGTPEQWNNIKIGILNNAIVDAAKYYNYTGAFALFSEENSISYTTPDSTGDARSYAASFTDLTPGVSYSVIVSKSSSDPLAPENLIYINQFRASSEGCQQSFRTRRNSSVTASDMAYVAAAGSYSFDDSPVNPNPGGDDSGSGGSSSGGGGGGGGGGAAVVLGVGVAAAVTAGVILTMPVDVQGRVELADHTAVPGAKISLLQNGSVVAQTTADDSGSFSLKAKRGDYELTVVYTDANGQFVQKTTSLKAPAKDLVITF